MTKRTIFSTISPLPAGVSRELVLDLLHNHTEMIDLNPLVIERHFINPPPNVEPDEKQCVWYSMTDKIYYLPGGKVSGDVSYTCAFHDLPNGIQTHCRAPLGVDIRDKWTLNGYLPGEPPEPTEIGIGAPASGLYIREDVDMRCNILMTRFVKKNLQKSHAALVAKLIEKARHISLSAERRTSYAYDSGRMSPLSIDQAMSRPWSPPKLPALAQSSYQRNDSSCAYNPSPNAVQEATYSPTQTTTRIVAAYQQIGDSYSEASLLHQVSSPYRALPQTDSREYFHSSRRPALRVQSQRRFSAHSDSEYLPVIRQTQQYPSGRILPPYPVDEDEDVLPAPLRIGGQDHGVCAASLYSWSSRSRASSELEHPMYPHLSPYSSNFTERSSSPDEPRTPESLRPREQKGYLGMVDHPDVLTPGTWRPRESLNGACVMGIE